MQLLTDNQAALALLNSSSNSARAKHIDIAYNFARECVERGEVVFSYCPTEEMAADMLTKALSPVLFKKCMALAGLRNTSG